MGSFGDFCLEVPADIGVLLFDIDDTLTTESLLTADAYAALARAKQAGLIVVPITGRPAGWCDHIARMWPVDAVVGENGAFYFRYDRAQRKFVQRFVASAAERAYAKTQLAEIAQRILREVPGTALASDQDYRVADIAIDFCEDVTPLPRAAVERIRQLMEESGLTAKISSIHVNGWFGNYDKLATTKLLMHEIFAIDLEQHKQRCVFVGDSPNDAPMFACFPYAVGVANVGDFGTMLRVQPRYVTNERCGAGFVEVVDAILRRRDSGIGKS
jgi:HAD superfamily hydrolase (TIGR01484 family)